MNIEFIQAKNGELTAKFNSLFLHSAYSPSNEAKRVFDNLIFTFTPQIIILCEPCINYIYPFFKKRFKNCKFAIIRYSSEFNTFNYDADFIFNIFDNQNLENQLFSTFTEEELCSALFIPWEPSSKAFNTLDSLTWKIIKKTLEKAKTLLITREYFENKWFLNSCKFIKNINNIYSLNKINLPVAITASGPSLNNQLVFLQNAQNQFFIISLSSSLSVLLKNNIIPDLVFSTDGGYWAGEHLKKIINKDIPLALSIEGFCPSKVLRENKIIPLSYNDGLSSKLLEKTNLFSYKAVRNGTVSGTALDFALSYFTNDIYFFGLDLAAGKGFQHTQPNEIETNNTIQSNKINSIEKRNAISSLGSDSLKIYEEWFINKKNENRKVYRVIEQSERKNTFTYVQDINFKEISKLFPSKSIIKNKESFYLKQQNLKSNCFNDIFEYLNDENFLKCLYPLDYVALSHGNGEENIIIDRIDNKIDKLSKKIRKIFNAD